ncbi:ArsR/SmtB family transcription factor [Bacillus sp. FJAT-45350]|uniref:ArsR/SmtB family transcription factor n=1 Tax=Bacillus sp. FJAT-45350 TaxID=2011014 RepID=UPI000BB7EAA5|nr:metalloregulator ArsR/SmtB family transcription factor [Bacillus sp. FJAT-45350]
MVAKDECEVFCVDEKSVSSLKEIIASENIKSMVQMFKALADDTRMKIAYALTEESELCVCDVATIIGSSTATASHHLRLLRNLGLAKYRKEGKLVYYSLDDEHIKQLIVMAYEHSKEEKGG